MRRQKKNRRNLQISSPSSMYSLLYTLIYSIIVCITTLISMAIVFSLSNTAIGSIMILTYAVLLKVELQLLSTVYPAGGNSISSKNNGMDQYRLQSSHTAQSRQVPAPVVFIQIRRVSVEQAISHRQKGWTCLICPSLECSTGICTLRTTHVVTPKRCLLSVKASFLSVSA